MACTRQANIVRSLQAARSKVSRRRHPSHLRSFGVRLSPDLHSGCWRAWHKAETHQGNVRGGCVRYPLHSTRDRRAVATSGSERNFVKRFECFKCKDPELWLPSPGHGALVAGYATRCSAKKLNTREARCSSILAGAEVGAGAGAGA